MAKIGIVTVLYNSKSVIEDFMESLNNQTYKDFILYAIDNKSPDESLFEIKKNLAKVSFPVKIIEEHSNWGVAKGNNIGIEVAIQDGCEYVLLSNNDVVLENDSIEKLFCGIIETHADMVTAKILFYNSDLIWSAGGTFNKWRGDTLQFGYAVKDKGQFDNPRRIDYAPTCFVLIHRRVFEIIGMMDEKYFVYFDDTDFMYRARKANIPLYYYPQSVIYHKESVSTGKMSKFSIYYLTRNIIYYTFKNRGIMSMIYIMGRKILSALLLHWKNGRELLLVELKGLKDGVLLCIRK